MIRESNKLGSNSSIVENGICVEFIEQKIMGLHHRCTVSTTTTTTTTTSRLPPKVIERQKTVKG
jgi:hypothetical protein